MTTTPQHDAAVWPAADDAEVDAQSKSQLDDTETRIEHFELSSASWIDPPDEPDSYIEYDQPAEIDDDPAPLDMPGRGIIVCSTAALCAVALVNLVLVGGLTLFFDLSFVTLCLMASMGVRRVDFFTAGVLPPLMLGFVIFAVALVHPSALGQVEGLTGLFLAGLTSHAAALVTGYAVSLGVISARFVAAKRRIA